MRGEYNTRRKRDMLTFLTGNPMKHYTLDELTQAMHEDGIDAGRTTVYRFVEGLAEQGRVRKYFNENESYYQTLKENCEKKKQELLNVKEYADVLIKEYEKLIAR